MTLNFTQGHRECRYSVGRISLPTTVVCSNNITVLYHFRDIIIIIKSNHFYSVRERDWL